jgi:sigma-B regulation protein RsbU (phosphoserine phosphatase)
MADRPFDPRSRQLPEGDGAVLRRLGTALLVPARSQSGVLALIALGAKLSDQDFDADDIEFAGSAAGQVAIGFDRVRTRQDEADFEQARALQQTLLPSQAPQLPGVEVAGVWQPARTVGGDYYDLLKLSDTQLGICIGDVAGKGMPAALLMSGLQAAVRASADPDAAPNRVTERVRRVVVPSLSGRFVSFFYCLYDTTTRRLRYCNAGHNPPLLVRADGSAIRLATGGPVLSRLFRDAPLEEGSIELGAGDRLVLFTDGVSEARDAAQNDFGEERLEQFVAGNRTLGARELAATIVSAVLAYAGGRPEDDLTLVTLAVTN